MRVPREIDELMWAVAEQRNAETNEQFLERYPEFSAELDRRVQMVSTLRGSRPRREVERFVPSSSVRSFGPSRLAVAGVALLVLASVTFATYATMQFVNAKRPRPVLTPEPQPEIVFNAPDFPVPSSTGGSGLEDPVFLPNQTDVPPVLEDDFDAFMGLVTIDHEEVPLSDAIEEIANKAGLRVQMAPGFVEKRISIRFVQQPAIEIIERMGATFGFSVFKQGKVELLIIPVAGGSPTDGPFPTGSVGVSPSGPTDPNKKLQENSGTSTGTSGN
jgi:hypothetical protein